MCHIYVLNVTLIHLSLLSPFESVNVNFRHIHPLFVLLAKLFPNWKLNSSCSSYIWLLSFPLPIDSIYLPIPVPEASTGEHAKPHFVSTFIETCHFSFPKRLNEGEFEALYATMFFISYNFAHVRPLFSTENLLKLFMQLIN